MVGKMGEQPGLHRSGETPGGSVYSPTGTEVFLLGFLFVLFLAVLGGFWDLALLPRMD